MTASGVGEVAAGLTPADLDYKLPRELIAQTPAEPRDASRLLVVDRRTGRLEDRRFTDLPALLGPGDILVRNDTRVFPARAYFRRATGGRIEALFLRPAEMPDWKDHVDAGPDGEDVLREADGDADVAGPAGGGDGVVPTPGETNDLADGAAKPAGADSETAGDGERWEALLRGRLRSSEVLCSEELGADWSLRCLAPLGDGRWLVASRAAAPVLEMLGSTGLTPLPPYITAPLSDPERYQTTYSRAVGSAAAPTAGLHFTAAVDAALAAADITIETVTLHVGLGTFKPLPDGPLETTTLHSESFAVAAATWARLLEARCRGRRIISVGTTSLRVLEHLAQAGARAGDVGLLRGETRLFVRPGCELRLVDGLLTNFHLPRTSLLALVMAVCGVAETRAAYAHAIARGYRFYSFGDAMLAL